MPQIFYSHSTNDDVKVSRFCCTTQPSSSHSHSLFLSFSFCPFVFLFFFHAFLSVSVSLRLKLSKSLSISHPPKILFTRLRVRSIDICNTKANKSMVFLVKFMPSQWYNVLMFRTKTWSVAKKQRRRGQFV